MTSQEKFTERLLDYATFEEIASTTGLDARNIQAIVETWLPQVIAITNKVGA